MRLLLAILIGKLVLFFTRFLKIGGGSAAPGLYALKIDPNLVNKLALTIPKHVVITGTNGKTTTARMLSHMLKSQGYRVIRNATGSNLERGIASTLIQSSHLGGGFLLTPRDIGIWELDEFAFNEVAFKLNPKIVVFLNVFRDQLDRYGEVDTVVKRWCQTLKSLPKTTQVLVNGDDINTANLVKCFAEKMYKFGVKDYKIIGESIEKKRERENLDFEAKNVNLKGLTGSEFDLTIYDIRYTIYLPLPGIYHIYDFLAAFAVGQALGFDPKKMISSLKDFSPAFGRVEKIVLTPSRWTHETRHGYIFLIKNPAGATQVFQTIAPNLKSSDRLLIALNDNLADGTDVSWIWDADFEVLQNSSRALSAVEGSRELKTFCSGKRAHDLAIRLRYTGLNPKLIEVETNLKKALKEATKGLKGQLFILPTYTALLELQNLLVKTGVKDHYWRDI